MATETLTVIIDDVLRNNVKTGKLLVRAYRAGSHRALAGFGKGIGTVLEGTGQSLTPAQRTKLLHVGQRFAEFADESVNRMSEGAQKAIDALYKGASGVVEQLEARMGEVDNPYASRYVEFATNLTLPTAKLARVVSGKIAEGTEKASGRLVHVKPAVRRAARKPQRAKRAKKAS